ncbi:MAG: HAD-IC family P-type ATPase, partial [Oscillospiraceae bacterium]
MTDNVKGLTQQEVEQRIKDGKVNGNTDIKTKSVKTIVKENIFTFFNFLNIFLALLVLIFGNIKNAMFLGVIVCNTAIGIFQEVRSKKTIDKLTLISAPKAHVIRDGIKKEIPTSEVVLDDLMMFDNGVQAVADCQIVSGECEVNESLITGESDPINKKPGDQILSGSFVVSGQAQAVVTALGEDSFANKITNGAKYVKKNESKMLKAINVILKVISICIFPLLIGLLVEGIVFSEEPS